MKTYLFPGQGSQSRGMGGQLFDEFPEITAQADDILGYSIKELCLNDPNRQLNKTQFTQPALYVVNALHWYKKGKDGFKEPHFVMGHSLGEYNALLAAGCFSFADGLCLVKKRAELMAQAPEGGMAAILNAPRDQVESTLQKNDLTEIDLANFNTPSQIVISGSIDHIAEAQNLFQEGEVMYCPLNTSGAFHSRYMQPSSDEFAAYLAAFEFNSPSIPVISNVHARPYGDNEVKENLSAQIASEVKWFDGVQHIIQTTAAGHKVYFEEVGHGEVLTKMMVKIIAEIGATEVFVQSDDQGLDGVIPIVKETTAEKPQPEPAGSTITDNESIEQLVNNWNDRYPIGTRVTSLVHDYEQLETRTEARILFGHRAAVYMANYNGYFDLREIEAVSNAQLSGS